jgi:hypothetical protein
MALSAAQVTGSVTLVTTAETAAVTTPVLPVTPPGGGQGLVIRGNLNVTTGASTTAIVIKVRQGSGTGGTQIGNTQTVTAAAAASYDLAFEVIDSSPVPSSQYTVTVTQTAATGNGAVNQSEIETDLVIP